MIAMLRSLLLATHVPPSSRSCFLARAFLCGCSRALSPGSIGNGDLPTRLGRSPLVLTVLSRDYNRTVRIRGNIPGLFFRPCKIPNREGLSVLFKRHVPV